MDDLSRHRGCMRFVLRMPTSFPSSATSGHPLSSARLREAEDTATRRRTDRGLLSDDAPRRASPSRRPGCLSPPRPRRNDSREGIAPSGLRVGSPAHAAHTFSPGGESAFDGHCKATVRSPAGPWQLRECRHLFDLRGIPRLGLTTQARPRARPTRPSARTDCLARTDVGRSA